MLLIRELNGESGASPDIDAAQWAGRIPARVLPLEMG
jgi:hypothetical protein